MTSDSTPTILLSVDTVRADRFSEDCFPESLAPLMEDFAYFSNAYSQGNATPFAFPAIITGHPVVGNGRFPDDTPTIGQLFFGHTSGFSNNGHLPPHRGYDRGFDSFHDQRPPDVASLVDRLREIDWLANSDIATGTYQLLRRLRTMARDGAGDESGSEYPTPSWTADEVAEFVLRRADADDAFVWGHFMDPHSPYSPAIAVDGPPVDRSPEEIDRLNDYQYETDPHPPEDMAFQRAMYDANIRYFDRALAELLAELRTRSWYDDALIVLVADHGELFGEHGCMFHPGHIDPVDELLETPLLVKYPDGEDAGVEFEHLVQHGDIIATIADQLDADRDRLPEGIYPLRDQTSRGVISKSNVAVRLTEPGATAIRRRDGTTEGLDSITASNRDRLEAASFPAVEAKAGGVPGVDEADRKERLEALGYR